MSSYNLNNYHLTAYLSDIASVTEAETVVPVAGMLTTIRTVIGGTLNGDAIVTFTAVGAGSAAVASIAIGTITHTASGSAEGDVNTLTLSPGKSLPAGCYIKAVSDGGGSTVNVLGITYTIRR